MEGGKFYSSAAYSEPVDVGIIILDSELRIQYWNSFITVASQKALIHALNLPLVSVFPEADTSHFHALVSRVRSDGQHIYTQWRETPYLIRLPGSTAPNPAPPVLQSTLLFPFTQGDGALCFGLMLYDSTDFSQAHEPPSATLEALNTKQLELDQIADKLEKAHIQLLQSERLAAIGQLAAGVAHEINNPVGYVFSNLKTLAGYVEDLLCIIDAVDTVSNLDELRKLKQSLEYDYIRNDVEALIAESEDGIDRVKKIITALKDFSHIEEDEFLWVDLHKGLESTLNMVNNELKYKADIIREFAEMPEVQCIASQINQVVMNLLINAAHAIEQFGVITLRCGHEGDWAWVEVQDTGKGIEPQILSRIYDPFFTTKPVGQGTGLGLTLSYNILQKHHGRFEVYSTPGKGSRFRFWLPLRQPEPYFSKVQA
ncbi:ATP-binding protein [Pseudomonas sp. DWP3-1-2]|uniref:ATP-binding protein n=1 Tax=Pseudomonas sp. DWP3-1-2 TaxID=2804645 RepID=UPI003CF542EE